MTTGKLGTEEIKGEEGEGGDATPSASASLRTSYILVSLALLMSLSSSTFICFLAFGGAGGLWRLDTNRKETP